VARVSAGPGSRPEINANERHGLWKTSGMGRISILLISIVLSSVTLASQVTLPVRLSSFAINGNGTRAGTIGILVERWSTDAERDALAKTFKEQGPAKALEAVRGSQPVGHMRGVETIGWELRFARETVLPDGVTRIMLLTDRPVGFVAPPGQPASVDHPYTVLDLRINKDGSGVGYASTNTKLVLDKDNTIQFEHLSNEPVRFSGLRIEK